MKDKFNELYKNLNERQKEAVDTVTGPVMVMAGPGTGKTTILTLHIANILRGDAGIPANAILAITYTDAGVKSMRTKLLNVIGERAYDVGIFTFHGFASSIIAEYRDHFIHISDRKQITDIEQETIIRKILLHKKFNQLRPSGKPDAYLLNILKTIDTAKRESLSSESIRKHANSEIKRIENDESYISTRGATKGQLKADAKELIEKYKKTILFADIYDEYENEKSLQKKMDFNDLIIELIKTLREDELLLRLIQEKYQYIHVDEHQDTNDSQNFIISILAEFFDTPDIFIVGDEKQAIYRFQGASVKNFMKLKEKWSDMKVIPLDINYRSHQGILDASFSMIEKNYGEDESNEYRIKLKSGGKEERRPIDIVNAENVSAMESYLIDDVKRISEKEKDKTIAIIVRRNRDLDRIISIFEHNNIPLSSERSIDIFNHPIGRLFFDLIEYISDRTKIDLLSKTIVSGMWDISFDRSIEILRDLRSGRFTNISSLLPQFAEIDKLMLSESPISFLIHLAEITGLVKLISKDPNQVEVWRAIVSLAESIVGNSDINDSMVLIKSLIEYRTSAENRMVKISVGAPDFQIKAMTAHGSKGLEYDYVYIPYATDDIWTGKSKGNSFILPIEKDDDSNIEDSRRLFYVAITRGKKHVSIMTANESSEGKILIPLRFIDELDSDCISNIHIPRVDSDNVYSVNNKRDKDDLRLVPIINLTKKVLLEKGLSVTALNHFIKCPNTFLYQSILKIPQAPSPSSEKGSAMHEAMDSIWKSEDKSLKNIESIMKEKITEFFANSFLNSSEKESAKDELLEDAPIVAKALESHFRQFKDSKIYTEFWVGSEIKVSFNGEILSIPIHGQLDTIVENGDDVYVFDYKTKQVMSVNQIKGDTASSDGGYFRQLVFYRLLLEGDIRWRNKRISPSLVFISPDDKGRCPIVTLPIEKEDIVDIKSNINKLVESVWSGDILKSKCDNSKCEWCGVRNL